MISRINPSEEDRKLGAFSGETIERASRQFRADGALIVEDIADTALIAEAKLAFAKTYARYLDGREHDDALTLGDRRLQVSVDLEPPFDDPRLFANAWLLPILSALLDEDLVLGACVVAYSLPAAAEQHHHLDGSILFPGTGIDRILPASAITIAFPLVEMNEVHGTTALWLGSHRDGDRGDRAPSDEPLVREGSCLLWDYRLLNAGTENLSPLPRPLLTLLYCRPWWIDHRSFRQQAPIRVRQSTVSKLPERHQRLLARAQRV
jgi:ectoine hydroxylase-related dioxygenase (phytanoyl-CoA dioxygenase family)